MAHCVTARWRNFSHYCRPLRNYDVWLRILIIEKHRQPRRQHTVYKNKRLEFATEQVGKLRYVTAVNGRLKRFPSVAWFAHPWSIGYFVILSLVQNLSHQNQESVSNTCPLIFRARGISQSSQFLFTLFSGFHFNLRIMFNCWSGNSVVHLFRYFLLNFQARFNFLQSQFVIDFFLSFHLKFCSRPGSTSGPCSTSRSLNLWLI